MTSVTLSSDVSGKERAKSSVAQVEAEPEQRANVRGKEHVAEEWIADPHVGSMTAPPRYPVRSTAPSIAVRGTR